MKTLLCVLSLMVLGLLAAPQAAHAQTRTWVSAVGDDANPCSRTAPCKTFAGAFSKTATNGEINCLDPGAYGATTPTTLTINKSISILCKELATFTLVGATSGITVNLPAGNVVVLDGIEIDGAGTGLNGVNFTGAGTLVIKNAAIRNFTQYGVKVAGSAGSAVLIEDSLISRTTLGGVQVAGAGGAANFVQLNRATLFNNGAAGVKLGPAANLFVSASTIVGSTAAVDNSAGGTTTSFANNVLAPVPQLSTTPLR